MRFQLRIEEHGHMGHGASVSIGNMVPGKQLLEHLRSEPGSAIALIVL